MSGTPIRRIKVQLETTQHRISGTLQLPTEGYRSRLTDYLNAREGEFLAVTDARIEPLAGGREDVRQAEFLAVACRQVVLAFELAAE